MMKQCKHSQFVFLFIVITFAMMLNACGDTQSGKELESPRLTIQPSTLVADSHVELDISGLLQEKLVVAQDKNLTLVTLSGDELFSVGDVMPDTVAVSPSNRFLVYGDYDLDLTLIDLHSREATTIAEGILSPVIQSWSPNEEWVVISLNLTYELLIASTQTEQSVSIAEEHATYKTFWLEDNTLLVFAQIFSTVRGQPTEYRIYRLNPATAEEYPVFSSDTLIRELSYTTNGTEQVSMLAVELSKQNFALAPVYDRNGNTVMSPTLNTAITITKPDYPDQPILEACNNWTVVQKPILGVSLPALLYQVNDVTLISDLTLLEDNSVLLLRWTALSCSELDPTDFHITLLRIYPEASPKVVAEHVGITWQPDNWFTYYDNYGYARGHFYDVSTDGNYVVWLDNDAEAGIASITITELNTLKRASILEISSTSDFEVHQYKSVFWIGS